MKLSKLLLVLIFALSVTAFFLSSKIAGAQVPGLKLPCDQTGDPEFHSLRPYQAAPCGGAAKAKFCSNTLIFTETFDMAHKGQCQETGCQNCTFTCDPEFHVNPHDLFIELDDSDLPILGNTENVKNSQQATDEFDDATKTNEYVSWYLSGVNNRAEYGENTNERVINFSGPVQKLLPSAIADGQRIISIENAKKEVDHDTEDEDSSASDEPATHNQIVVCESGGKAVECPNGSEKRLLDWDDGNLSFFNTFFNWLGTDIWNSRYPPLPWQFKDEILYQKAYNEWRGNTCAIVFGSLNCGDNPLVKNEWANLFQYVPLANTPDKKGAEYMLGDGPSFDAFSGTTIANAQFSGIRNAPLYFAHTQEDKDLSELLNKTYIPQGVESIPLPETTEKNGESTTAKDCRIVNIRSNEGDDLFPGDKDEMQVQDVEYDITEATCHETTKREWVCFKNKNYCDWVETHTLECPAGVEIKMRTGTKSPWAKEIWSTTVADSASTFRKLFPKVQEGAPVTCIANMPTETTVTYDATKSEAPPGGDQEFRVKDPLGGDTSSPKLYFPYIGSVYEYFLKGIQTALRPQGYGEPITDGTECIAGAACGELPKDLPKGSGSCSLGGISSSVGNIPQSLKDIIEAAAETYKVPPNLILGVMYGEGLFDGNNKKDWTEENVKNWATCQPVPGCSTSGDDNFMGFFDVYWDRIVPNIESDLKKLDPNREAPSQCNLLDAIYGVAWNLHDSADGGGPISGMKCFGLSLNASVPSSCSWDDNQYESAIKVSGSGYENYCLTKEGSCFTGGGQDAACPLGDTCETLSNRYSNTSHNGCVWDVAHGQ